MFRVLIIDDDPEIIELVRHGLPNDDFALSVAGGSLEAQSKIARQKFDAILLDIGLPGNDGISFLKYLHGLGITRTTPVLMITGSASKEHVLAATANGSQGFIRKPFKMKTLVDQLSRVLSLHDIQMTAEQPQKSGLFTIEPDELFAKIIVNDHLNDRIVREIFVEYNELPHKWPTIALDLRTQREISIDSIVRIKMLHKLMIESRLLILGGKNFGDLVGVFSEDEATLVISEIDLRRILRAEQKEKP